MKTSNKILLGLMVIVFTVPFLLASSLKSKMNKGEYTIEKNENTGRGMLRSGSFTAFKVIKVLAPGPDFLSCHLKLSANMNYTYYNHDSKDSVTVFTSNDTLYIKYAAEKPITDKKERRDYNNFEVDINLPAFNNLVVDGAIVIIDSIPDSSGNLSVTLKNNGEIKDGSKNSEEESAEVSKASSLKKDKVLQVSEISKADVISEDDTKKLETTQNTGLELLNVDMKDLLIYGLLYRI